MKEGEVRVGARMHLRSYNGAVYELRADGWWYNREHVSPSDGWEKVNLSYWGLEKTWIASGYRIEYPKENLFDKLYLTLKQST